MDALPFKMRSCWCGQKQSSLLPEKSVKLLTVFKPIPFFLRSKTKIIVQLHRGVQEAIIVRTYIGIYTSDA